VPVQGTWIHDHGNWDKRDQAVLFRCLLALDDNNRKRIMKMIKSWFSKLTRGEMVQTTPLLIVPVICSLGFAACSHLGDTPQNQPATTSGAYIEQREEQSADQPVDANPESYEWFY
jgi:hypothetical protein